MSASSSPRQTLSYLRGLFEARGIRPKNKLGQNFLIDLNLLDVLLRAAELTPKDLAVEVGSGTGSLTLRLAEHAGAVFSVEIDADFAALTEQAVAAAGAIHRAAGHPTGAALDHPDHVVLFKADVLKNKNEIRPEVMASLDALRQKSGCERFKLVANLPYAVAVPVIANFLLTELPFERMVVTVQWEIAERLLARPGTKDYSALTVLVQSLADVSLVRQLSPAVFWPRPKVSSAIVAIRPSAAKRAHVGDAGRFRSFLRDLYVHRRKNLRGALASSPSGRLDKAEVDRKLAALGLDGTCRAEELGLEEHLRLCAAFG